MIISKDDIKTDDDLHQYGWELRLIQVEEDIYVLNKRKKNILNHINVGDNDVDK